MADAEGRLRRADAGAGDVGRSPLLVAVIVVAGDTLFVLLTLSPPTRRAAALIRNHFRSEDFLEWM